VFDNRHGRRLIAQLANQFIRGVRVIDVIVGERFALNLSRRSDAGPVLASDIESRILVRVLAIAQRLVQLAAKANPVRSGLVQLARIPTGNRCVIRRRPRIGLGCELAAGAAADPAARARHLGQHRIQVTTIRTDRNEVAILGRGAQHGRTANIDILDTVLKSRARRHGRFERVEVDINEIDRLDTVFFCVSLVAVIVAQIKQAAMHGRVQRLHPPIHHFRIAGEISDVFDVEPSFFESAGRAAG